MAHCHVSKTLAPNLQMTAYNLNNCRNQENLKGTVLVVRVCGGGGVEQLKQMSKPFFGPNKVFDQCVQKLLTTASSSQVTAA